MYVRENKIVGGNMDILLLNKLKRAQIEIMDEVHRICELTGVKYYIIGGTALGAKRHSGFIHWDLDIDIAMSRRNYERFAEVCGKHLSEKYSYKCFKNFQQEKRMIYERDVGI